MKEQGASAEAREILVRGLAALGLEPTEAQVGSFMTYLGELKRWSRAYSLTSLKSDMEIVVGHFLDSCLYLKGLDTSVTSVADVGSGAGLPGLPLKIMRPELNITLIEPTRKKAAFLRYVAGKLAFGGLRVMECTLQEAEGEVLVDVAVTRALWSVEEFVRRADSIVKPGGQMVMSKGPKLQEELKAAKGKLPEYRIIEAALPFGDSALRQIVVISKP